MTMLQASVDNAAGFGMTMPQAQLDDSKLGFGGNNGVRRKRSSDRYSGVLAKLWSRHLPEKEHSMGRRVKSEEEKPGPNALIVGTIIKRLRLQRDISIRDVADGSGLSPSFLSAVERGESDISIGRLARIAEFFDHDVGSLLGYSTRLAKPNFLTKRDRALVNRGKGVRYEVFRLPGLSLELVTINLAPRAAFRDELTHEGIDTLLVISGEIILRANGIDYPMQAGDCTVYSAAYSHGMRNDSLKPATAIGMTTAKMM